MKLSCLASLIPSGRNLLLAILSAVLLIGAFPDFEYWFLAWFALVPLMWAVDREKASPSRSFILGWLFGTIFFFGTCWWLTYAPITYAGFPPVVAYLLLFCLTAIIGVFPGIFALILSVLLRRFGIWAFLAAPFVWVATEFARYWITGNNWNAIGYSQFLDISVTKYTSLGGVLAVSFAVVFYNIVARNLIVIIVGAILVTIDWFRGNRSEEENFSQTAEEQNERPMFALIDDNPYEVRNTLTIAGVIVFYVFLAWLLPGYSLQTSDVSRVIAIQPNVPMSGMNYIKSGQLRNRQVEMAETKVWDLRHPSATPRPDGRSPIDPPEPPKTPILVVLPESPMNFQYDDDPEFRSFINNFAIRNNVSVLFNSAEPDAANKKYFNSAVMIDARGREVAQYDKIYLLPFGESVPVPLEALVPAFVGNFSYGKEYDLLPLGEAKAGVMICFESHFGELSREYVRRGADAIIEMTNDGYLGPTPVLRQHLANAVFRAVETNRPVLRVTNVGITAYINEKGEILDPTQPYQEDTRVWSVSKSDGSQTFYVKYGDWFAWICTIVTIGLLTYGFFRRRQQEV